MVLAYIMGKPVPVYDIGLAVKTEADGLAVGTASALVLDYTKGLVSGSYTVQDDDLMRFVYHLKNTEDIKIEPSAAAGFLGPIILNSSESGKEYMAKFSPSYWENAQHIMWTTGGLFVPDEEYKKFYEEGARLNSCV
jgi:D-serine dehydratase